MKNEHVKDQLSAYMDKMLSPTELQTVETHLSACADCRQVLKELQGMVSWMKRVPKPEARAGLETRLKAQLAPRRKPVGYIFGGLAGVAVAALVLLMVRATPPEQSKEVFQEQAQESRADRAAAAPVLQENKVILDKPVALGATAKKSADFETFKGLVARKQAPAEMEMAGRAVEAFVPEVEGQYCGITRPEQVVIRSQREWEALLQRMNWQAPDTQLSSVDFSKDMIVGVFAGEKSSAGHSIRIEQQALSATGNILTVYYRNRALASDMMGAAVMTSPFHLRLVDKFDGEVKFEER